MNLDSQDGGIELQDVIELRASDKTGFAMSHGP